MYRQQQQQQQQQQDMWPEPASASFHGLKTYIAVSVHKVGHGCALAACAVLLHVAGAEHRYTTMWLTLDHTVPQRCSCQPPVSTMILNSAVQAPPGLGRLP